MIIDCEMLQSIHHMYDDAKKNKECYNLLSDELSKRIFWARMKCDMEANLSNTMELSALQTHLKEADKTKSTNGIEHLKRLNKNGDKIIIYGTRDPARWLGTLLEREHIDYFAFCSRNAHLYPDGLIGKRVLAPDYIFEHTNEVYVINATKGSYWEIEDNLSAHGFPQERILRYFEIPLYRNEDCQYYEFPQFYRQGTAFVDGGCLNGWSSILFSRWVDGNYSKIFAFEPSPEDYQICRKTITEYQVKNVELIQAGLSNLTGTATFASMAGTGASFVVSKKDMQYDLDHTEEIQLTSLDEVVGDQEVGFIKLDIEGSEFDALLGAIKTIKRDKPLLAVCVYHRDGDVLALMNLLHSLVPEYRFWLRQYKYGWPTETVLYAATHEKCQ